MPEIEIRAARESDLPGVVGINEYYVLNTVRLVIVLITRLCADI